MSEMRWSRMAARVHASAWSRPSRVLRGGSLALSGVALLALRAGSDVSGSDVLWTVGLLLCAAVAAAASLGSRWRPVGFGALVAAFAARAVGYVLAAAQGEQPWFVNVGGVVIYAGLTLLVRAVAGWIDPGEAVAELAEQRDLRSQRRSSR